ncbi:PREDICTED: protein NRT1/ PTR FAMILY 5.5-like isoform X1 [Nicotiana attenuata]|uniref:Protein nrt1 ptr family 5.5 n=2 Tax=Nicotiana attenuata TaxID=49451 RepID=A0A1J6ISB9_NICAT|nr:PREDICTED: protein NRT1/ PTR FAMILY 5.5-like isoform X1 [Nicotiana attenuata]OIT07718.1 protein nrt1 ptr family 5.5 [Nicotiana attenuata]
MWILNFFVVVAITWANFPVHYALWMLMVYLTDVWKVKLTDAAAIVNVFLGLQAIPQSVLLFSAHGLFGNYPVLLGSIFACCVGMGFLTMSTPPVLAKATGTCSAYQPECIGEGQRILFYIALALSALGAAGQAVSFPSFLVEQLGENANMPCIWFLQCFAVILFKAAAVLGFSYISPWSLWFGVPAICYTVAAFIFLSGSCIYKYVKPEGSPITTLFRVLAASISKLFYQLPTDASQLYNVSDRNRQYVPHTNGLRCLDKAAIILPDQTLEEQLRNRWRLCSIAEIEVTKFAIRTFPMSVTFILAGVMTSLSYTYFLEQAKTMNNKVGNLRIPLAVFLWFQLEAREKFPKLYHILVNWRWGSEAKPSAPRVGVAVSIILGVLCTITAAKVESRRLAVVKSYGLAGETDEKIPMTVFWLLPQYLLLGAVDGMFAKSLNNYYSNYFEPISASYMLSGCNLMHGLGCMSNILLVYIVSKVSRRGNKLSWFQDTLNKSRLDKYYWTLSWLLAIAFVLFVVISLWYAYRRSKEEARTVYIERSVTHIGTETIYEMTYRVGNRRNNGTIVDMFPSFG